MKSNNHQASLPQQSSNQPDDYEFRVKGRLIPRWSEWFEGLTVTVLENEEIILYGPVSDQAALHGLIAKIRDLNLSLLSMKKV